MDTVTGTSRNDLWRPSGLKRNWSLMLEITFPENRETQSTRLNLGLSQNRRHRPNPRSRKGRSAPRAGASGRLGPASDLGAPILGADPALLPSRAKPQPAVPPALTGQASRCSRPRCPASIRPPGLPVSGLGIPSPASPPRGPLPGLHILCPVSRPRGRRGSFASRASALVLHPSSWQNKGLATRIARISSGP